MKVLILMLVVSLNSIELLWSQTLSVGFGPVFTHSNQRVKMVESKEDFMNTAYQWSISYEHPIPSSKFIATASAARFEGATMIKFSEGSVISSHGYPLIGAGFFGVDVTRVDLQLGYNVLGKSPSFYFKPKAGIGIQVSKDRGWDILSLEPINGPDYVQLADIRAEVFNTVQVVPVVGFKTGFLLWRRVDLGVNVQGVWGFKSYTDLYFDYAYRGEVQETAVFEATGTGIFTALHLGYRFGKRQ